MAIKTEEKQIGACIYRVSQLGAIKGRAAFLRLVKALGPIAGGLVDAKGKQAASLDLGDLMARLTLTEDDLTFFCDLFAEKTFIVKSDGKTPRLDHCFDDHFAGRYLEMIQWLAFAVQVNFADFFGAALNAASGQASPSAPTEPAAGSSR